ncbi:c-type cytochrome domain-containing protein [Catenovulum adriaticum]|uniref:Cytochrome c n=1 Tax=Catenovulum adriaticum TaxID=2984846 RepID=A0ABY7ARK7_9ALTE|nr:c-type cytochrome domain-containing protein [Catenovulum sp. TS8]WAJ71897.1 hypothetical protein OLW01_14305 [Catenovulum sp. TS8]
MQEFIYFLGRFHVLALHVPFGVLFAAILFDCVSRYFNTDDSKVSFYRATTLLWGFGFISALAAIILGYFHSMEPGFGGQSVSLHMWSAIALACVVFVIFLRRLFSKPLSILKSEIAGFNFAVLVMLVLTGHYGGNITHGETYLTDYAPAPLKSVLGIKDIDQVTAELSIDQLETFNHVVQPMLQSKCASCHNNDKRKGQLSLASYEQIVKGGKNGSGVTANDLSKSEIYQRIILPPEHKLYMPKSGKKPFTEDEIKVFAWWVKQGAPQTEKVIDMNPTDDVLNLIKQITGVDSEQAPQLPTMSFDENKIAENGFYYRQVAQGNPLLKLSFSTFKHAFGPEQIALLSSIAPYVYSLELRKAEINDDILQQLPVMENLQVLNLAENPIQGTGLYHLQKFKSLKVLNLFATQITKDSSEVLANMKALKKVYIWQTPMYEAVGEYAVYAN